MENPDRRHMDIYELNHENLLEADRLQCEVDKLTDDLSRANEVIEALKTIIAQSPIATMLYEAWFQNL